MKRATILIFTLITLLTCTISCKKSNIAPLNRTPEQILTATPWKILEITGGIGNLPFYYKRGGSSNTINFDNEYYLFKPDQTGTYVDNTGLQNPFTWSYSNAGKTRIMLNGELLPATPIYWENIILTDNSLKYNESYTIGNTSANSTVERIPK
jgi:hypothetical protein